MFKKMIEIATSEGSRKYVYLGEKVDFCTANDFNDEFKFCEGRYRLGLIVEKKKRFYVEYYDAILDEDFCDPIEDIRILGINPDQRIRNYFDNLGKGGNENEGKEEDD